MSFNKRKTLLLLTFMLVSFCMSAKNIWGIPETEMNARPFLLEGESLKPEVPVEPACIFAVSPSTTICAGTSTTLWVTFWGSPYTGATWAPSTGLSATTGASVVASPTTTTTYTMTPASGSCIPTQYITVTVTGSNVTVSSNQTICAGGNVALTAANADTYSWAPSTGLSSATGATVTASPTSTTTYTVTGTSTCGSSTATVTVTVNGGTAAISASVQPPTSDKCNQVNFYSTITGCAGGCTYLWNFGDGGTSTAMNPSHTFSTPGVHTVTFTVTGEGGCVYVATIDVTICVDVIACTDCIGSFAPIQGEKYVIGAWVQQSNSETQITYTAPTISIDFAGGGTVGPFTASGNIIDGWQRIDAVFTVPYGSTNLTVKLNNAGPSGTDVNFDDVRIYPLDGSFKTFVYDPITTRLMAELDENNYATFYEYDEEGALIRVKKETERGVKTIQESGNNVRKEP